MNLNQAAHLMVWSREQVKVAIRIGITPPGAPAPVRLHGTPQGRDFEITEDDLNAFLENFESAEPGRHPPVAVRRQLLFEARESCCICGVPGPFEFHHLIDWGRLHHHDAQHMMLVCRNCHGRCTNGSIDGHRQRQYKDRPFGLMGVLSSSAPTVAGTDWAAESPLRSSRSPAQLFRFLRNLLGTPSPPGKEAALDQWVHTAPNDHLLKAIGLPWDTSPAADPRFEALLTAYELAVATRASPVDIQRTASPYVDICVASLLARGSAAATKFAHVDRLGRCTVMELKVEVHENQRGCLFAHPGFAEDETIGSLSSSLDAAWVQAAPAGGPFELPSALWSVRLCQDTDTVEAAVPVADPSAASAALRLFWHVRRGLKLDGDVYVLVDYQLNGSVHPTADLGAKLAAIHQHHRSSLPPTLIVAAGKREVGLDDVPAFDAAAVVREIESVADMFMVRSCGVEASCRYLDHLADQLDMTPWSMDGRPVRLSEVHVFPNISVEDIRIDIQIESSSPVMRDRHSSGYSPNRGNVMGANPFQSKIRRVSVAWQSEFLRSNRQTPILVVGGPGAGKSSILAWTARSLALDAKRQLESRTNTARDVPWPVFVDLDQWAQQRGSPQESLRQVILDRVNVRGHGKPPTEGRVRPSGWGRNSATN